MAMPLAPEPKAEGAVPRSRPPRPIGIELAAAVLTVGGVFGVITLLANLAVVEGAVPPPPAAVAIELAIDVVSIVVGLLARTGRGWILGINVTAVFVFLYLTALPNAVALTFAVLDGFVFVMLLLHRPWFDAMKAWRDTESGPAGPR